MRRFISCIGLLCAISSCGTIPSNAQSVSGGVVEQPIQVQYVPWNNDPILPPGLYFACDNGRYLVNRVPQMGKNQFEGNSVNYAVERADRKVGCRPQTIDRPEEMNVERYVSSYDGFQIAIWRVRQYGFVYYVAQSTGRLAGQLKYHRQPGVICGPLVHGMTRAQVRAWHELCG